MAGRSEINKREQWILDELLRTGKVSVEQICQKAKISPESARRHLRNLERQGRLRRNSGGAVSIEPFLYEPFVHVSSYAVQIEKHAAEKRRIALAAASLIRHGETVALSPGTTTNQVARCIPGGLNVTVVCSTVNVAMELSNRPEVNVFVTGGFLHGEWFSLVGQAALRSLGELFPDKVFVGANGVHPEHGVTAFHPEEAAVNSFMIRQSRQRIVVADQSKLGVIATHLISPINEINMIITDFGANEETVRAFAEKGIEVRKV